MRRVVYYIDKEFTIQSGILEKEGDARSVVGCGKNCEEMVEFPNSRLFASRYGVSYHLRTILNREIFNKMKSAIMLKAKLEELNDQCKGLRDTVQPDVKFID